MPGTPRPINSAFGNRPSTLPNPVPAAGAEQDVEALFAEPNLSQIEMPAHATPGSPASSVEQEVSALFSDLEKTSPGATGKLAPQSGDEFVSEGEPYKSNMPGLIGAGIEQVANMPENIKAQVNQFKNIVTRFQAGLASNDNEVVMLMQKKFGQDNVRWKDGKVWFRNPGEKKFEPLDPKQFEIFSDLIPDFARGFIEEGTALPFEAAGAAGGTAVAGPPGAGPGAYAGRVASGPAQVAAADYVAEKAGVPQDPSRNKVMEMAVQSTLEAAMPVIGKRIARLIPGTEAYKAAKEAGERELTALSKQSQAVAQSVQELAEMNKAVTVDGSLVGVPGAQVNLGAHQLNPESPKIRALQEKAQEYPGFNNAMRKYAEDWGDLFEKTMNEIAVQGSNNKTVDPSMLSKNIVDAVANVRKIEGENIAKYKAQAIRKLGDKPQPMIEEVAKPLGEIMQAMNFVPDGRPVKPEELQKLVGQYGITSIGEARAIVNNVQDVMTAMKKNGGMSIRDMDRFRNSIGDLADRMRGTPAGRQLAVLASGFRENYKQVIESGIDNEFEKVGFRSAMDDYGQIMKNIDVLRNALDEDSSAQAIVQKFFTGRDNIERLKSIKSLSPESFDNLRSEWINQQLMKFKSRESATGFQAGAFLDKLDKQYGPEFMNMVFPKEEQKTVKNFLTVMERIDKTFGEAKIDQASEKMKQGLMNSLIGVLADVKFKWVNGLSGMFKGRSGAEHAAVQLLTRDGIDKYVANYPGKPEQKRMIADKLKQLVANYRLNTIINTVPDMIDSRAGKSAARIGTREYYGDKTKGIFQPMSPNDNEE